MYMDVWSYNSVHLNFCTTGVMLLSDGGGGRTKSLTMKQRNEVGSRVCTIGFICYKVG